MSVMLLKTGYAKPHQDIFGCRVLAGSEMASMGSLDMRQAQQQQGWAAVSSFLHRSSFIHCLYKNASCLKPKTSDSAMEVLADPRLQALVLDRLPVIGSESAAAQIPKVPLGLAFRCGVPQLKEPACNSQDVAVCYRHTIAQSRATSEQPSSQGA